jgi:hypothetical protein
MIDTNSSAEFPDVPVEIYKAFLSELKNKKISDDVIMRLHLILIEKQQEPTERNINNSIFPEL